MGEKSEHGPQDGIPGVGRAEGEEEEGGETSDSSVFARVEFGGPGTLEQTRSCACFYSLSLSPTPAESLHPTMIVDSVTGCPFPV